MRLHVSVHTHGGTQGEHIDAWTGVTTVDGQPDMLTATVLLCVELTEDEVGLVSTDPMSAFTDDDHAGRPLLSAPAFLPGSGFRISAGHLVVKLPGDLPLLPLIEVTPRQAWFAELTHSVAVVVRVGHTRWFGVVPRQDHEPPVPLMAIIRSKSPRVERQLVEHSQEWAAAAMTPQSNLLGEVRPRDVELHWTTYEIRPRTRFAPKTRPVPRCGLCGDTQDVTTEHCTPNWLATHLGLTPVTAPVLCRTCNGALGRDLEPHFQRLYLEGRCEDEPTVTAAWALKTMVMLSLAVSVHVPPQLTRAVIERAADAAATQVHVAVPPVPEQLVRFSVTTFGSSLRARDAFVGSVSFGAVALLVTRWPNASLHSLTGMTRMSPAPTGRRAVHGPQSQHGIHWDALHALSGEELSFTEAEGQTIRAPRGA